MKLFKEIQVMRRVADTFETTPIGPFDYSTSGFLFMNYDFSDRSFRERKKTDDVNDFLYKTVTYELCSKTKTVNTGWNVTNSLTHGKRYRALHALREKMHAKV